MSDPVEQAAEAMCRADNAPTSLDDEESYEWDIKAMLEDGNEDGDYYRRLAVAAIAAFLGGLCEQLSGLADAVRDDIKEARKRADAGNEEKSYLRGELQGILAAFDIVSALPVGGWTGEKQETRDE